MPNHPFAPAETFAEILKYMPVPTFDLILYSKDKSVIILKRKISPYKNVWALPGLRMYKTESINETLSRIAKQELGLKIDPNEKKFIGQYVGKFKTENNRQDISTCYAIKILDFSKIKINVEHFFEEKFVASASEIPKNTGAMYKYYLKKFFER